MPNPQPESSGPHWQSELERHLRHGDAAAATMALWWWLAGRLVGDRAKASWTSRELVHRAGRRNLIPAVRRLDHMLYGTGRNISLAKSVDGKGTPCRDRAVFVPRS